MTVALFIALASGLLVAVLQRRSAATSAAKQRLLRRADEPALAEPAVEDDEEITLMLSAEDVHDLQTVPEDQRPTVVPAVEQLPDSLLLAILEANEADAAAATTAEAPAVASVRAQAEAATPRRQLSVRVSYEPEALEALEAPPSVTPLHLVAGGDSDRGHRRKKNEDNFLFSPGQGLFVVADGMGGYAGGSIASGLAIETLRRAFDEPEPEPEPAEADASEMPKPARELACAVQRANQVVFDVAHSREDLARMGTTLVALRFALPEQRLYVVHAGDSRCYRLRQSELRQLTTDHVMAQLGVQGRQAAHLFNAIGIEAETKLDLLVDRPVAGDTYLLCSDGLSKMVSDEVIRAVLMAEEDVESAVYTLIEHANDAGGRDNVTVVLAKVEHGAGNLPQAQSWSVGP